MFNDSKYDSNLHIEKLNMQENFLYYYNDHLCTMFSNILNINPLIFAYNSNITGNVTVQCSLYWNIKMA